MVLTLAVILLATPLVSAVPGDEKSNEKFEYFELLCSGTGDGTSEKSWDTYLHELVKTGHGRGAGWTTGSVVELTVGEETFDKTTDPISVDYTTTYDIELRFIEGVYSYFNIRLTDVVTVYNAGVEIGTLVLKIRATADMTATPPVYKGTVVGYGTGQLAGVHISAVDIGVVGVDVYPSMLYGRVGTITGWPEQITND